MKPAKMAIKQLLVLQGVWFVFLPLLAFGQSSPGGGTAPNGTYRLKEAEIKGELKDVMGKMRLLESEIIGSVERPRLSYSLPWQEAFLPVGPEKEIEGDLLEDPFPFVDPMSFER